MHKWGVPPTDSECRAMEEAILLSLGFVRILPCMHSWATARNSVVWISAVPVLLTFPLPAGIGRCLNNEPDSWSDEQAFALTGQAVRQLTWCSNSKRRFRHPSSNHCHNWLRHRSWKTVSQQTVFRWCSNGGTFVTDNSNYIRGFFHNRPRCLRQHK